MLIHFLVCQSIAYQLSELFAESLGSDRNLIFVIINVDSGATGSFCRAALANNLTFLTRFPCHLSTVHPSGDVISRCWLNGATTSESPQISFNSKRNAAELSEFVNEWRRSNKKIQRKRKEVGPHIGRYPFCAGSVKEMFSRKTKPITAPTTVLYRQMRRSSTSLRESKAFSVSWRNMKQMDRTSSVKCASEKWNVMKQLLKNWPP